MNHRSYELIQKLERHWAFNLSPCWSDFLLDHDHESWEQHALKICQLDLNWRIEQIASSSHEPGSQVVVQTHQYWQLLKNRISNDRFQELASLEFQLRWSCGLPISSAEFRSQLTPEIHPGMFQVVWTCPNATCEHTNDVDETATSQQCHSCNHSFPKLGAVFSEATMVSIQCPKMDVEAACQWADCSRSSRELRRCLPGRRRRYSLSDYSCQDFAPALVHRPDVVSRFMRESRILGMLDGDGTPFLRRAGRLPDGRHYFQMQRIEGVELRKLLTSSNRPRSWIDSKKLFMQWQMHMREKFFTETYRLGT